MSALAPDPKAVFEQRRAALAALRNTAPKLLAAALRVDDLYRNAMFAELGTRAASACFDGLCEEMIAALASAARHVLRPTPEELDAHKRLRDAFAYVTALPQPHLDASPPGPSPAEVLEWSLYVCEYYRFGYGAYVVTRRMLSERAGGRADA